MPEENGESRRKMKVRDDIEKTIEGMERQSKELMESVNDIQSVCKTLRWVIGDGQLPDINA